MAELIISLNNQIIKKIKLAEAKYLLGRSNRCDIVLNERTVSAEHAQLIQISSECFLEDLQSTNGVYVNYVRIQQHYLVDHDLIQIGKYELVFQDPVNRYKAVYDLCTTAKALDDLASFARLELMSGEKIGYFIPLKNNQFILSISNNNADTVRIETTPDRQYLLHSFDKQQISSTRRLQSNDKFQLAELVFKFHEPTKLAKL